MIELSTFIPGGYTFGQTKYVVVFGTVMSGLGKGIFASSLASVIKSRGLSVVPIKLEGYLNIDSGTLNPCRHGEVFVLDDGTECDMDLGTYERMLDINLTKKNFITSGQIFTSVLDKERRGEYLGRDVQVIPHVTGEVKLRLRELAVETEADIVFVEVGGTVGDVENVYLIEAIREMSYEEGSDNFCFVALTHISEPKILGEQKSKPAQLGLKLLNTVGIQPHLIGCRASCPVTDSIREKLSMFSSVPIKRIFSMHDCPSVYDVPDMLESDGVVDEVLSILGFELNYYRTDTPNRSMLPDGVPVIKRSIITRYKRQLARRESFVKIAIIGKYTSVRDSYASIIQALEHCSCHLGVRVDIEWIDSDLCDEDHLRPSTLRPDPLFGIHGVIVPGGFGTRGTEGKLECIRYARRKQIPFLGICYGMQLAAIEFARNVAWLDGANSAEIDKDCKHKIVDILPDQEGLVDTGGTMRLGGQEVVIEEYSLAGRAIGGSPFRMRFRHRYEINPEYISVLEEKGMVFSGWNKQDGVVEILELPRERHPFFVATQSHPEFLSRPTKPEPLFRSFVSAAIDQI